MIDQKLLEARSRIRVALKEYKNKVEIASGQAILAAQAFKKAQLELEQANETLDFYERELSNFKDRHRITEPEIDRF